MTRAFPSTALSTLKGAYPESPVLLTHDLVDHPLLSLEALAELAGRIRPVDVEYNRADLPIGLDPEQTPSNGLSVAETIRSIEQCGSWMVLKFIEQDPIYRSLLDAVLSSLEPAVHPATGAMLKVQGFIFVSSPDAVTPFHFDPEHNVLLQIRGSKRMTVFPADDDQVAAGTEHERFHAGGHRNLPWDDALAPRGTPFELVPGSAVYVPVKAPHWVKNGPQVSVSLSVTWRSEWSFREEYARKMNRIIRGLGVEPRAPRRFPHQNHAKSLSYRVVDKVRRLTGKAGDMIPQLLIVVDTEEEFDWSAPFSREATATRSIQAQLRAHEIFDRLGVVPTYVIDYPVATDPAAVALLARLKSEGRAEIGAHLHPWVTPPHDEMVTTINSYQCNLPLALERAKIETLTAAITDGFGERPTIFKAGRHGFGKNTPQILAHLGYEVDCSQLPFTDLRRDGGPDFRQVPLDPYWLDRPGGLLEIPLSIGFFGAAAGWGPKLRSLFDSPGAERLHLPGLFARSGLVTRSRLTPEGVSADEQCRLMQALVARGHRILTLVYHSPSLEPGHTPYVRNAADLSAFLASLEQVLLFFRDQLGGQFTTASAVRRAYQDQRAVA